MSSARAKRPSSSPQSQCERRPAPATAPACWYSLAACSYGTVGVGAPARSPALRFRFFKTYVYFLSTVRARNKNAVSLNFNVREPRCEDRFLYVWCLLFRAGAGFPPAPRDYSLGFCGSQAVRGPGPMCDDPFSLHRLIQDSCARRGRGATQSSSRVQGGVPLLPLRCAAGRRGRGRQTSQSALAASVASRYALGADGVGAAHPGACGSRVTSSRHALGAEGRHAPERPHVRPRLRTLSSGDGGDR